jgi:hypothetical protein
MNKQALIYSLKVWLTTAIVSSVLIFLMHLYFLKSNGFDPLHSEKIMHIVVVKSAKMMAGDIVMYALLGLIFSYCIKLLSKRASVTITKLKGHLTILGVAILLFANILIYSYILTIDIYSDIKRMYVLQFCYNSILEMLVLVPAIWVCKLNLVSDEQPILTDKECSRH